MKKAGILLLQWTLGFSVLIQALLLAFSPVQIKAFHGTGFPDWLRLAVAWSEIAAATLFLIPPTMAIGGYFLLFIFLAAIGIHLHHGGGNIAALAVYAASAFAVVAQRQGQTSLRES
jgi:hypothetical protein